LTEVVVCCGLGGTGKTTTSAAIALSRARAGQRVVVLTIDPARRLADALHLPLLGSEPTAVPLRGLDVPGSLHALMLDRKGTWDAVVLRFSPDADVAERLLANRYYAAVSTRLTGSHEYMAIEKLAELVEAGRWDVVVVDTPPTQHLLDFLDAPERILRVFDRSVLSALVEPEPGFLGAVTRKAVGLVNRIAGDTVMGDIHEFFRLISGLSGHFRERGKKVGEILAGATWLLVVNARAPDRADLESFLGALSERGLALAGLVVARVSPEPPPPVPPEELASWLAGLGNADEWTQALLAFHASAQAGAALDRAAAARLAARAGNVRVWTLPDAPELVGTLAGLVELSASLA
jgi:anion-transporting  ArsA/GET3 family ATPase